MYNKNQFRKMNEKKVLHKVKKHWVIISAALLMMIGGKAVATQTAHADANNQNDTHDSNSMVNTIKDQLNANLIKAANQQTQTGSVNSADKQRLTAKGITAQARALHNRIMANTITDSYSRPRLINNNNNDNVHNNSNDKVALPSNQHLHTLGSTSNTSPRNHQLTDDNSSSIINNNGNTHKLLSQIKMTNDTIDYQNNGQTVGSFTMSGQYGNTFTVNSTDDQNMPNGYHLTNATQTYNYNGGTHDVPVTLSPDVINLRDIYSDVDGFEFGHKNYNKQVQGSINQRYTLTSSDLPKGWSFVDQSGNIIKPSDDSFNYDGQAHTFNVAPIYRGMTYKYNASTNSTTFVNGTANNDLSNFISNANSAVQNSAVMTFSNNVNMNNVTNMENMFQDADHLKTLNLGDSFNTDNVTNMKQMFMSDDHLSSLTLPSEFNTGKVTDMSGMFFNDLAMRSLDLPEDHFNTSNVTNMAYMFCGDVSLPTLRLPNSFNTSKVNNMDSMFTSDRNIHAMTMPSAFDTTNVTDMSDMFGDSTDGTNVTLNKLVIQSLNTKLIDRTGRPYGIALQPLYKLDNNGDGYTAANANDFSQGNVGTFITPSNPKVTLTIQYEDATTGLMLPNSDDSVTYDHIPGQKMTYNDLGIAALNSRLGKNYKLINGYTYGTYIKPLISKTSNQIITVPIESPNVLASGQWNGSDSAYYVLTKDGQGHVTLKFSSHGNESDQDIGTNSWSYAMNSDGQPAFYDDGFSTVANALNRDSINRIVFSDGIKLPSTNDDHRGLFADMKNLSDFNSFGLKGSDVISTEGLFANDPKLTTIDVSNLRLSNNKSMKNMFRNDVNLKSINLGNNPSSLNLSDVSGIFQSDPNLTTISGVDNLNTGDVVTMDNAFRSDKAMNDLNIPDWQSARMSSMNGMFANDPNLITLNIMDMMSPDLVDQGDINAFNGDSKLSKIVLNRNMHFNTDSKLDGEWMSSDYSTDPVMFSPRRLDNPKTDLGLNSSATWIRTNEQPITTKIYNQSGKYLGTQIMYKPFSVSDVLPTNQLQLPNGYYWAPSNYISDGVTNQNLNYNSSHETAYVIGDNETTSLPVTVNEDNGLTNAQKTVTVKGHYGDMDDHVVDANAWATKDQTPVGYTLNTNQGGVDANGKLHYNFAQGVYQPNGNAGWNNGQPKIHYTARKESVNVIFETDDHNHVQSDTLGPVETGKSIILPGLPTGYDYVGGPQPNTVYQITPNNVGKAVVINVNGEDENVPVEFIDQDNHQIGKTDYSRWSKIGSDVSLPTTAPEGYTLNSGQPSTYQVAYQDVNSNNHEQVNPVKLKITGNPVTLNVQYKLMNGQNLGSLIKMNNVRVGDTVDLTKKDFPANYSLAVGNGDPIHYTVVANDLIAPDYNQTRILPIYVASDIQDMTIDYVDAAHNLLLDHRVVPVHTDTTAYLTNNNVTNNSGNNANGSFVKQDSHLMGYTIASGQNLMPTAKLSANGIYPVYTVNMQSLPLILHVTYYDPRTNQNVGSDNITKNANDQTAMIGDLLPLPTVANANQNGLRANYVLDQNQASKYYAWSFDSMNNGHVVKNIVMLAHGQIDYEAPVTVVKIDANGDVQSRDVVHIPIYGDVGDTLTFNSSDFRGYIPQGYVLAADNNSYNHVNYQKYNYTAELTPSDASQVSWQSNSWRIDHHSGYWDSTNQRPMIIIQATNDRQLLINFINQDGNQVGSVVPNPQGSYRDVVNLQDPAEDGDSILKNYLPSDYVYGSNNPSSITYAQDPKTVNINVVGRPETVYVEYDDPAGHRLLGSVSDVVTGHHVGDSVTLPTAHLPQGYRIINDRDLNYTIDLADDPRQTGVITRHVIVTPDAETLPIKFVDQNGAQVGDLNYQTHGMIDQTGVALPNAPIGYTYTSNTSAQSNPTHYDFKANQMDVNHDGFMKTHVIHLNGDAETLPVNFVDQRGRVVPNGDAVARGYIGDTINLPKAPNHYQVDNNQPSQYQFTTGDIQTPGQMKPIDIYVRTARTYPFNVNVEEYRQGTLVDRYTKVTDVTGSDGYSQQFKPSDYVPSGFRADTGDNSVTSKITAKGLNRPNVVWKYNATNSSNNNDQNDRTTAQPLIVTYYDPNERINILSDQRINGYMNQVINVDNPAEGGIAVPSGYALDNNQPTVHQITTSPQIITLNVHGIHNGISEFRVDIVRERHNGTTLRTSQNIVENGNVDSPFQIQPGNYVPVGYHLDTTSAHQKSDQIVNGIIQPSGLNPSQHTFYYQAGDSINHQDGVQPINVTYYDDRTGAKEGTNVVNGYMDQTFGVDQLGIKGLKYGYQVDANQSQTYVIGTQPTNAHVMVHGNASMNQNNDDVVTIKLYREDPYGNVLSGQPEYAYDTIHGNVGDQYDIKANDYLLSSYQLDTSYNRDQDFKGTILPDGKLSNNSASFYYRLPASNEMNLNSIHVMYEDDNDHDIVKDEVIVPTKAHDDYSGKFVDVVADDDADNQQSPIPQGYDIDSNQYTQAAFSQKQPTYIDVLVHADQNSTQYNDTFNQIEQFYDGDQLTTTNERPQTVKGVDGSSFTVNAPSTPVGYVAGATNPAQVSGYVEQSKLVPGSALYKFNATNSINYDHPSDHNHAQPIFVTFKNGNVIVGKSNQRVDGYMNQKINVLTPGYVTIPSGYRVTNDTNVIYQIGVNIQHQIIDVVPEIASDATVVYEDQKRHNVVAQRPLSVPVGTELSRISSEYTNFVPYGYDYFGVNWNHNTMVTNDGQYIVYVTKQDARNLPRPTTNSSDGRIFVNYQSQNGQLISSYELIQPNGTRFNVNDYMKSRDEHGQMPDNFSNPMLISGGNIRLFNKKQIQNLTIKVNTNRQLVTAHVEYEDAKTRQIVNNLQTSKPLSISVTGHAGDNLDYSPYQQFIPQGYTYYGMGNHDSVLENGDTDVVMVRKAKTANNQRGFVNVNYYDQNTKQNIDTVKVAGINGQLFNLGYYENDLPSGYDFKGTINPVFNFNDGTQTVTINVKKLQSEPRYGSVKICFVRADSNIISSGINGNQNTSNGTLATAKVPNSYDETMTGHIGDLFNPQWYEHNTPQGTTFSHVVKGNNISMITKQPQALWIAVQTTNGRF